MLTALFSGLAGAFIAAGLADHRNNLASLHQESNWRESLYRLTGCQKIGIKEVHLLRTCVSAYRSSSNAKSSPILNDPLISYQIEGAKDDEGKDKRIDKSINMDDLIINYCNYLSDLYYSSRPRSTNYWLNPKFDLVFRQLCRLLLKSDWEIRKSPSLFINGLEFFFPMGKPDYSLEKAVLLFEGTFDISIQKELNLKTFKSSVAHSGFYFSWWSFFLRALIPLFSLSMFFPLKRALDFIKIKSEYKSLAHFLLGLIICICVSVVYVCIVKYKSYRHKQTLLLLKEISVVSTKNTF